jgi:hypothetical protein
MQPWFIATETFTSRDVEKWANYVSWSHLSHLVEVVSLDSMLCPTLLPEIKAEYWPHIVNENFMLNFFVDLEFLIEQLPAVSECNLLCVYRNPAHDLPYNLPKGFEFLGYDLVDVEGSASALTNCCGYPDVFDGRELSPQGLLTSYARALQIRADLRAKHPHEHHADCDLWAIARAVEPRLWLERDHFVA